MNTHAKPALRGILAVRADAGGDTKKILADLQKDWSEFKATMETKDAEVKAKFDDVVDN